MNSKKNSGQALIEYIIVLAMLGLVSTTVVKRLGTFLAKSSGNMAYVMSLHLSTGICPQSCFFAGYVNGREI